MKTKFWAVFLDETGCEFGSEIEANSKAEAIALAGEWYTESRLVQIESPQDARERQQELEQRIAREIDGDGYDYGEECEW